MVVVVVSVRKQGCSVLQGGPGWADLDDSPQRQNKARERHQMREYVSVMCNTQAVYKCY